MTPARRRTPGSSLLVRSDMHVEHERQRGLEAGRYWAQHASSHDLTSIVAGSFDDLSALLPPKVSDHFVGGFREAVQRVRRGA